MPASNSRKGEILGFAGLIGSGRTELMEAIVGLAPAPAARITAHGKPVHFADVCMPSMPPASAYMTKDRKGKGLLLNQGLTANLTLQSLEQAFALRLHSTAAARRRRSTRPCARFDIRVRDAGVAGRAACRAATSRSCCSPR